MNDRRYRFEDDLEENNRIYEELKKDVVGNKSITTEQIKVLCITRRFLRMYSQVICLVV